MSYFTHLEKTIIYNHKKTQLEIWKYSTSSYYRTTMETWLNIFISNQPWRIKPSFLTMFETARSLAAEKSHKKISKTTSFLVLLWELLIGL